MGWFQIYNDLLCNLFIFLALDLFINTFGQCVKKEKQLPIKITFLCIWIVFSIIPEIPFIVLILTEFIYTFIIARRKPIKSFVLMLTFRAYYFIYSLMFALLHTFLTLDFALFTHNNIYASYVNIIDCFLMYITLCMYIIFKKLSLFPTGKIYKRYFLAITGIMSILLIVCSLFLGSTILKQEDVVPLFFTLLLVITLLCISIYHKVVSVLEENMLSKIEAEKNKLQQEYAEHVEDNLKSLSVLRHDFKNHLIALHGYANDDRKEELLNYIQSLTSTFSESTIVNTPSQLLSSLVNAKRSDCEREDVRFDFEWDFCHIRISDYALLTIVSNLLDNALTAASKCEEGFIELKVYEKGTFLEIDCVNNHMEKIQKQNERFLTTKTTQPEIHGLGLISIKNTVEKLTGELQIDYTDDCFHINIFVPNYI